MKVVALQTWSNGTITMEEKSVQDIPDALAEQLIADGICADAAEYFGGGGGDTLLLEFWNRISTEREINGHTYAELHDALTASKRVIMRFYPYQGERNQYEDLVVTLVKKYSNGTISCSAFEFSRGTINQEYSFIAKYVYINQIQESSENIIEIAGITTINIPLS